MALPEIWEKVTVNVFPSNTIASAAVGTGDSVCPVAGPVAESALVSDEGVVSDEGTVSAEGVAMEEGV